MADTYFQTRVEISNYAEYLQSIISEVLETAVELQNNTLIISSETPQDLESIETIVKSFIAEVDKTVVFSITEEEKENRDWVEEYKKGVKPIEAAEFYIRPSWYPPLANKKNIIVDPSLAFGTGEHPTTNLCVVAISKYLKNDQSFLDVGCGSGILALAAASKGAIVDLCDTDVVAVNNSKENFELNALKYRNIWTGSTSLTNESYDFVVANIVSDILIFLKKDLTNVLNNGGILVLSGILNIYKEKVLKSYKNLTLVEEAVMGEWTTLILKKDEDEKTK